MCVGWSAAAEPSFRDAPRLATVDDVDEVVRLAGVMYEALGAAPPVVPDAQWARWVSGARQALVHRMGAGLAVFVHDRPGGGLVACGAGSVAVRLPSPWQPDALAGYVQWMSTDVDARRQGYGRSILRALLGWFEQRGVDTVELHASPAGVALYRAEGFWGGSTGTAMRRRTWDPPPPVAP